MPSISRVKNGKKSLDIMKELNENNNSMNLAKKTYNKRKGLKR